jgi:ferrous iron transport protein B
MATRTIENRGDRILTMLINPFMSCSARLPIYLLVAGVVFPRNAGSVLFAIYAAGILVAILMALLFKKTIFKTKEAPFVMELPPYRIPTTKVIIRHMWHKGRAYLKKMGGVILIASIIIWALGYFPKNKNIDAKYSKQIQDTTKYYEFLLAQDTADIQQLNITLGETITSIKFKQKSEHQKNSFIGKIGVFCEPIMRPLGFDWKMTVGVITGISAKEIVVSTLGVLYQSENEENLTDRLKSATYETGKNAGKRIYTPAVALAFMVFVLIYFPCIATIAAVKKETGSWKWALFMVFYTTALAWVLSFAVFQISSLLGYNSMYLFL